MNNQPTSQYLKIGDCVTLFSKEKGGFMSALG